MAESEATRTQEWTIGRLLGWTRSFLESKGVDEARLAAEVLLAHALDCRRIDLYARFEEAPTDEKRARFRELVAGAGEHKPIAYLVGHKEFYSLDFLVTPDVLIPRPETELLVERALSWLEQHATRPSNLLDIGTGSGCIAVTICKRAPDVRAVATDISEAAIAVAGQNAAKHGVTDRVRLIKADLLDLPADCIPECGFDVVVSNPPYVAEADRDNLPENVRRYEPAAALYAGPDGLSAYRRLAASIRGVLRPDGRFLLEVGHDQADAVAQIMQQETGLTLLGRFRDLAKIERALEFTLPA